MVKKFLQQLGQILKTEDIRKRILFTFAMLLIFRLLSAIPLPGINGEAFIEYFGNNPLGNIFAQVTGGRLDNPSIVAFGLASYINASIVIQLLASVIPKLEELQKEGEHGRQVINQYTRILTIPLSILQGLVIYTIMKNTPELKELIGDPSLLEITTMVAASTGGTIILMWISELISEQGIGNGSSVVIFTGILASLPGLLTKDFQVISFDTVLLVSVILGLLVMIAGIIFVTESTRKIPIQYARRVRGRMTYGGQSSYLPLKINQAGVMPVIFASSIINFPQIITRFFLSSSNTDSLFYKASDWLNQIYLPGNVWVYNLIYFIAIISFTFFYTFIVLNPSEQADNLKKSGGFIPGIRPGSTTSQYITKIMIRLTIVGAIFLATVSIIPTIAGQGTDLVLFSGIGGTSILIIVGVIMDIIRQFKSMLVSRSYDSYK